MILELSNNRNYNYFIRFLKKRLDLLILNWRAVPFDNNLTLFRNLVKTCLLVIFLVQCEIVVSQIGPNNESDSLYIPDQQELTRERVKTNSFSREVELEYRPAWILPVDPFYHTEDPPELSLGFAQSGHLKYAFALPNGSLGSHIFPQTSQGIGIAVFDLGKPRELGTPVAAYLFQKSSITRLSPSLSLDYEWNFGISIGWKPYDADKNPHNIVIGSTVNAYINLGLLLKWQLSQRLALAGGVDFTHFSNGNTEYPNAGLNLPGTKIGLAYDLSVEEKGQSEAPIQLSKFPRHISYDVVLFGSWKRKGVAFSGEQVASPHKYPVVGAYFAPMYNWGYRFRTGISLDALYDGSANVYTKDYIVGTQQQFFKPALSRQLALGASVRTEYVMPFFTIGVGLGTHFLHNGGDFKGTYQSFALKLRTTRNSFIHIGYNVKNFHDPNHLMLGIGYRFNNRTPSLLSNNSH